MAYVSYATIEDFEEFTGISLEASEKELIENMLLRSSEIIKIKTFNNINSTNANHMEAAKLAACSQVNFWRKNNTNAYAQEISSYRLGDLSVSYGNSTNNVQNSLCSQAAYYLKQQYLLYKGGIL